MCHGPLRLYVMGQRGADREPATPDEIVEMGRLAAEGIRAGALGFTTSRTLNHRTSRGEPTPTLTAAREELVGIARAIGETGCGVLQVVSDFPDGRHRDGDAARDDAGIGSAPVGVAAPGRPRRRLPLPARPARTAQAEGLAMRAQVAARAIGVLIGLQGSINPLSRIPSYQAVAELPLADQARILSGTECRRRLGAEVRERHLPFPLERIFELGDPPDYEPRPDASIMARAQRCRPRRRRPLHRPPAWAMGVAPCSTCPS